MTSTSRPPGDAVVAHVPWHNQQLSDGLQIHSGRGKYVGYRTVRDLVTYPAPVESWISEEDLSCPKEERKGIIIIIKE